jgi:hypothetical protein
MKVEPANSNPPVTKVPREWIVVVHVEAKPSPDLCAHVLNVLIDTGALPVNISIQCNERTLAMDVMFDGRRNVPLAGALRRLGRLQAMKWLEMRNYAGCPDGRVGLSRPDAGACLPKVTGGR